MSVAFDTLKFARALRDKAHMSAEQAEGVAEAFGDATTEQLATKSDLERLGGDLKAQIAGVRSDLRAEIADVKSFLQAEIADVKSSLQAEIADVKSSLQAETAGVKADVALLKWMMGFGLALLVAVFGKLFLH